jgi:hypothetical protein
MQIGCCRASPSLWRIRVIRREVASFSDTCTFSGAHKASPGALTIVILRACVLQVGVSRASKMKTAGALKIFRKLSARMADVCYFFSFGQKPIFTEGNYIGA